MSVLRHFEASPAERSSYLKMRRAVAGETEPDVPVEADGEEAGEDVELGAERYAEMSAAEQIVLTISENGYGKRSSSYEYRTSGRGGKGIIAMTVNDRNGPLVASFAVEDGDQIMLVTDGGQLIRCPVDGISMLGRSTQGVRVFTTAKDERVVSVSRITEEESEDGDEDEADGAPDDAPEPDAEA